MTTTTVTQRPRTGETEERSQDWPSRISARWQQSVEAVLDVGQMLLDAKAELEHGSFEAMVEDDLPFGSRTARMLMSIASHPVLSNRKHVSVLPASWGTLYDLSRLPDAKLSRAIGSSTPMP